MLALKYALELLQDHVSRDLVITGCPRLILVVSRSLYHAILHNLGLLTAMFTKRLKRMSAHHGPQCR
jgi:hypothetical protein